MREIALLIPPLLPLCLLALALTFPLLQRLFPRAVTALSQTSFPIAPLGLGLAILSFLVLLLSLWATGRSHPNLIGGLLPWNDAAGYFYGANALLDSGEFTSWSQRRPIYTSLLAGFLSLTGRDFQLALLVQGTFAGAIAFFVARTASLKLGIAAGFLVFALLFSFAQEHAPLTMTENAGFFFGALGIAFLWLGAEKPHAGWFAAAGLFLTFGLLARAGAFFVIPLLFLAIGFAYRDQWRVALRYALGFLTGAGLAVLLNQAMYWFAGDNTNMPNANFSYVLYGLAAGGKGWQQIYVDHPTIFHGGEGIVAKTIYALAFERIVENPFDFLAAYAQKLPHSILVLFDYLPSFFHVRRLFAVFWLVGLFVAFRNRREPYALFLLAAAAGVVLSGPFLADVGSRIYAATITLDALLAGLGFSAIVAWLEKATPQETSISNTETGLPAQLIGTATILFGLTFSGVFLFPNPTAKALPKLTCNQTEIPIMLRLGSESPLIALRAKPSFTLFPPQVSHGDFAGLLPPGTHLREKLGQLPPETTLIYGYAKKTMGRGKPVWIAWRTETLPERGSLVGFCLKPGHHPLLGEDFREPASVRVLE